jgi:hypothetical protein
VTLDHFQVEESGKVHVVSADGAWESLSPAASRAVTLQMTDLKHTRLRADVAELRVRELERRQLAAHEVLTSLGTHTCDVAGCPCPWTVRTALATAASISARLCEEDA